ncbi:hypothetical protein AAW00_13990 [Aurantiacibacter luteus]|uniref:Flagellar motor switch protein FliN-like C-terminal domain-containing protein n=2 Tax=Aurantiacibacter luteus TaxID=1581420 RepID=A0A0G9MPP4_9SPHN|nr:hypothetical protein AAW00_13990 [Aurantiacibacter luteus]
MDDADRTACLAQLAGRLCRRLPPALAAVIAGAKVRVAAGTPCQHPAGEAEAAFAGLATAGTLALPGEVGLLVMLEMPHALRLTDRLFGGNGELPDPLPGDLPMTAELVLARLDQALCEALTDERGGGQRPQAAGRSSDIARAMAAGRGSGWTSIGIEIEEEGREAWSVVVALDDAALDRLARMGADRVPADRRRAVSPDPLSAPFADLPFDLTATLLELTIPFSRLSDLKVGDRLPVAIPRDVELTLGPIPLATGTIGTREDRVALRLSRVA